MMRVVDLHHEIRDGELQLMRPQPSRLVLRSKTKPRPKIKQDIRGLCDDQLARLEDWRGERWMLLAFALDQLLDHVITALARHIDVIGTCLFQREPYEFAATLDIGPVVKLVAHRPP